MPMHAWNETAIAQDYETFNAWLYALDLFVPLVKLGQQEAWVPTTTRGNWGWFGFHLRWVFQATGWIITAVGAAGWPVKCLDGTA